MSETTCPACGANIGPNETECKYCGEKITRTVTQNAQPAQQQAGNGINIPQNVVDQFYSAPAANIDPSWPVKSKVTAGLLGIFLGGLGIHKFYLGKIGMGILYIVFCWTYIPALVGLVEGIIYLASSDESFQLKNHVRLQ
ncbi:MAG: NINE protein [Lachnospiraceae bacterium]|nr:NINE protein [Lachnospiraceae bacterium]